MRSSLQWCTGVSLMKNKLFITRYPLSLTSKKRLTAGKIEVKVISYWGIGKKPSSSLVLGKIWLLLEKCRRKAICHWRIERKSM